MVSSCSSISIRGRRFVVQITARFTNQPFVDSSVERSRTTPIVFRGSWETPEYQTLISHRAELSDRDAIIAGVRSNARGGVGMKCAHWLHFSQNELKLLAVLQKTEPKARRILADLPPYGGLCYYSTMSKAKQADVRKLILSYREFKQVTGLSKKEADSWVKNGLIRAELASNGRRRLYRLDSVIEGLIAKQLADFSSRTLLPTMMAAFRQHLQEEKVDLMKLVPDPSAPKILIQLYTRKSKEIMPGGGLRGVVAYVSRFDPRSEFIGKNVYLIVDLIGVAIEAWAKVRSLQAE